MHKNGVMSLLQPGPVTYSKKVMSALFLILFSVQGTFVDKNFILAHYVYPPYPIFGLCELVVTVTLLWLARRTHFVQFPSLDGRIIRRVIPLLIFYFCIMASGLDEIDRTSRPLLNVSSRCALIISTTLLLEQMYLGVQASGFTQFSVAVITAGGLMSVINYEPIKMADFVLVVLHHVFIAAHGVYSKKMLDSRELGVCGLWYYNSLVMLGPTLIFVCLVELWKGEELSVEYKNLLFWCHLVIVPLLGIATSYMLIVCILYNGALTTAILGSLMITLGTWFDVLSENTYPVSTWNYVGLSIVALGGLAHIYEIYKPKASDDTLINQNLASAV